MIFLQQLFTLLCWIPFFLLFLGTGIAFALLGYKRGVFRSLISIASTTAAALLSLLFAKLLSSALSRTLVNSILQNESLPDELAPLRPLFPLLLQGICACLLFPLVFLLLLLIVKNVVSFLTGKKVKNPPKEKTGLRVGGLALSLVDAFLLTLLFLTPLYGTLSHGASLVSAVSSFEENEEPEMTAALEGVAGNPLLKLAKAPPSSLFYDSLMTVRYQGTSLCTSRLIRSATPLLSRISSLSALKENPEALQRELRLFLSDAEVFLRESRPMFLLLADSLRPVFEENETVSVVITLLSSEEWKENLSALSSLFDSADRNGVFTLFASGGEKEPDLLALFGENSPFTGEFLDDFTAALNKTDSLASIKVSLLETMTKSLTKDEKLSPVGDLIKRIPPRALSEADARREAISFRLILTGIGSIGQESSGQEDDMGATVKGISRIVEGLACHPSIGPEAAAEAFGGMLSDLGIPFLSSDLLKDTLTESVQAPGESNAFSDLAAAAIRIGTFFDPESEDLSPTEVAETLFKEDPAVLRKIVSLLNEETLGDLVTEENADSFRLLKAAVSGIANTSPDASEAEAFSSSLQGLFSVTADSSLASLSSLETFVSDAASSKAFLSALTELTQADTESPTADPFGLSLSKKDKKALSSAVDAYAKENGGEALRPFCLFFGIDPVS